MLLNAFVNYNGMVYRSVKLLISPESRSFRYGDGFFETMKMINGKIPLADLHFERLFSSLELLKFEKPDYFTPGYLLEQIDEIAKKNQHTKLAKIRLMIFRGDGGLFDPENLTPNFLIETSELDPESNKLNKKGLVVDVYKDARKSCDSFSVVKSNNYLPQVMGALWAKENKLNDAVLINNSNRIAESTIANIFIVDNGIVKTPSLSEGCVGGVMRKHLLQVIREEGIAVQETKIKVDDLLNASEVFLTNAVSNIRWVKKVGESSYESQLASLLYKKAVAPLVK